jgi:hypothetical protein
MIDIDQKFYLNSKNMEIARLDFGEKINVHVLRM